MDINTERMTERQFSMVCYQLGNSAKGWASTWLPPAWRNMPGKPEGEFDWSDWNLMVWMRSNLTKTAASALITAVSEGNMEGAKIILTSNGCPIV